MNRLPHEKRTLILSMLCDMDWWLVVVVGVLVALGSVMVTLGPKQRSSSN